jgi:hypothetical protein
VVRITETKEFEEKVRVHEKRYRDLHPRHGRKAPDRQPGHLQDPRV